MNSLDRAIIAASGRGDSRTLAELYQIAAEERLAYGVISSARFFYTQAYIFALECGHENSANLQQELRKLGGEE